MSHPQASSSTERRSVLYSRLLGGLVVAACAYGAYARLVEFGRPPVSDDGITGMLARNYVKYGYPSFGLAQIMTPGPRVAPGDRVEYLTHPPLVPLMSSVSIAIFGPSVWSNRLPHLVCGFALVAALAAFGMKLGGRSAGAWCAIAAATLPMGSVRAGSFPCGIGPALVLCTTLMSWLYLLYAGSGLRRHFWLLVAATVGALLADWPAYVLAFCLAGHAVVFRVRAKWSRMIALPVLAVLLFALSWSYSRSVPERNQLWGTSLGRSADNWSSPEALSDDTPTYTAAAWCLNVGQKFLEYYSPLVVAAAAGLLWTAVRALRTRANDPAQHVLMLWLWIVPYFIVFSRAFYAHIHYHVLFLPAMAITLGLLADSACQWVMGRSRAVGAVLSAGACLFMVMWTHHVMARPDPFAALRAQRADWAADLARETAPDQKSAFVLHYAYPMRFLADRAVFEQIDTVAKLDALMRTPNRPEALLVPVDYPFGNPALAKQILNRLDPPVAGASSLLFSLGSGSEAVAWHFVGAKGPMDLGNGFGVQDFESCGFVAGDESYAYVGATLAMPRTAERGESLEWEIRFFNKQGPVRGSSRVPAAASAAYFLDDLGGAGRYEMVLCRRRPGRPQGSLAARLARHVLRLVTFDVAGRVDDEVERLLVIERDSLRVRFAR